MKSLSFRYRVRFPDGERELDAPALLTAFEAGELTTETLIAPADGGEWRSLRSEPDLLTPEVFKLVRAKMLYPVLCFWAFLFFACIPFLPLLLSMLSSTLVFANWQIFLFAAFLMWFIAPSMIPGSFLRKQIPTVWLFVPYVNSVVGFLTIRKVAPQTRWVKILNPLVWLWLAGGLVASWFLPGNVAGGIAIFSIWLIWIVLAGLLMLPGVGAARRRYRQWRLDNPPPDTVGKVRFRFDRKSRGCNWWRYLPAFLLAIVFFLAPYYIVGKIRLFLVEWQIQKEYIPTRIEHDRMPVAKPNAAEVILTIEIPKFQMESTAAEAEKLRPQLDRFRAMLRQYERLGSAAWSSDQAAAFDAYKGLREYLRWRMLLKDDSPTDLLRDLHRCRKYELNEAPGWGDTAERDYAGMQKRILQDRLREFSAAELLAEKKLLLAQIDAFPGNTKRYVYAQYVTGIHQKLAALAIPFCFQDNLAATALQLAREEAKLRTREWYDNIDDYRKFVRENAERSIFLIWFVSGDWQNRHYSATLAQYRLALAAIDVELYRREHGRYPENPQLPRDPFSGKPLGYIPGKMLYSVNPDGVNNGDSADIRFELKP